jgi:hypothetical protein
MTDHLCKITEVLHEMTDHLYKITEVLHEMTDVSSAMSSKGVFKQAKCMIFCKLE